MGHKRFLKSILPLVVIAVLFLAYEFTQGNDLGPSSGGEPAMTLSSYAPEQEAVGAGSPNESKKARASDGEGPSRGEGLSKSSYNEGLKAAGSYSLTNKQYKEHIVSRHGPDSKDPSKSLFLKGFDIKAGIHTALTDSASIMKPNTNGRDGWLFEYTYDEQIGRDKDKKLHTIRVVLETDGFVVTAFPVK